MGYVTFSYANFVAAYPEFAACSDPQLTAYFNRAGLFFDNTYANPAACAESVTPGLMEQLMWLLTAHLAWLYAPRDPLGNPASTGQATSSVVGRISSAGEGSVNVSAEWNGSGSPSEAFFLQTRYGAEYWQATAQFRTARYYANLTVVPGTGWPYPYGGYWRR